MRNVPGHACPAWPRSDRTCPPPHRPDWVAINEPPTWTAARASRAANPSRRPIRAPAGAAGQRQGSRGSAVVCADQRPAARIRLSRQSQGQAQPRQDIVLAEARDDHERRADAREDQEHAGDLARQELGRQGQGRALDHEAPMPRDPAEQAAGEVAEHRQRERQGQQLGEQDGEQLRARRRACSPASASAPAGGRSATPTTSAASRPGAPTRTVTHRPSGGRPSSTASGVMRATMRSDRHPHDLLIGGDHAVADGGHLLQAQLGLGHRLDHVLQAGPAGQRLDRLRLARPQVGARSVGSRPDQPGEAAAISRLPAVALAPARPLTAAP